MKTFTTIMISAVVGMLVTLFTMFAGVMLVSYHDLKLQRRGYSKQSSGS